MSIFVSKSEMKMGTRHCMYDSYQIYNVGNIFKLYIDNSCFINVFSKFELFDLLIETNLLIVGRDVCFSKYFVRKSFY